MIFSTQIALTTNWIAEPTIVKADNSYFRNLCHDSIVGLRRGETVYVFNREQVVEIERRVTFCVESKLVDGIYELKRKIILN